MTRDEILKTVQQLSKRTGFSIQEIAFMVRMIVQAEYDPLPPEQRGEPFEFPERKISVTGDSRDFFDPIHAEIPKPNSQVDLLEAWKAAEQDQRAIAAILARSDLSLRALFQIYTRLLDWERFFAVRYPDPEIRKASEKGVREMESMLNGFNEKAKAILRRRGVEGECTDDRGDGRCPSMNMTTVLFGDATSVAEVQNSHPATSGLHLPNSNLEVGELAVKKTAGPIGALVARRPGPSFWICQRKEGREQWLSDQKNSGPRRRLRLQPKSIRTSNPILSTKSMVGPESNGRRRAKCRSHHPRANLALRWTSEEVKLQQRKGTKMVEVLQSGKSDAQRVQDRLKPSAGIA